jgi:hypothetical protein
MKRWFALFATLSLALDAILSKSDMQTMFTLSRSQWEANAVAALGLGRAMGSSKTGIGLSTETSIGLLEVVPVYFDSDAKPIQIIVGYRPPAAALLSDAGLQDAIRTASKVNHASRFLHTRYPKP